MQGSFASIKLVLAAIRGIELSPPARENEPFRERYEARKLYLAEFEKLGGASKDTGEGSGQDSQEILYAKAALIASVARNHFDTDENNDGQRRCRQSLELWARLEDAALVFEGANWICGMLNLLGYYAVFAERFYEGILCLDAAEKVYSAVKAAVRRSPGDFPGNEDVRRDTQKRFLGDETWIGSESRMRIGKYVRDEVLGKLKARLQKIETDAGNPELGKTSSKLIAEIRALTAPLESAEDGEAKQLGKWPEFSMQLCEEHLIQSLFFQAQVFGKLLEKDLSAEYCGRTLQRQYFKFLWKKQNLGEKKAKGGSEEAAEKGDPESEGAEEKRVEGEVGEGQTEKAPLPDPEVKEAQEGPGPAKTGVESAARVPDFDYKDFINNVMGLCMYYSEKLMFRQGAKLLALADEILGDPVESEHEEITMLRASLLHMKANVLRDFFMFTCLTLKESGAEREQSKAGHNHSGAQTGEGNAPGGARLGLGKRGRVCGKRSLRLQGLR